MQLFALFPCLYSTSAWNTQYREGEKLDRTLWTEEAEKRQKELQAVKSEIIDKNLATRENNLSSKFQKDESTVLTQNKKEQQELNESLSKRKEAALRQKEKEALKEAKRAERQA